MNPANSSAALAALQGFQKKSLSPDAMLQRQYQTLGVPGQQQQVSGLRQAITNTTNLLNQVAPSVYGRTGQSLVTTAQAGRQIQNEQAPIQQNLSGLGTQYSNANADLSTNEGRAQAMAQLEQQGQEAKLSGLKDIYSALYQKEQDALARKLKEREMNESIRQFNAQLAESRRQSSSNNLNLDSFLNDNQPKPTKNGGVKGAIMQQRKGGGFSFTINGKQANALQYATATGRNIYDVLKTMAKKGDSGAKQALGFVGGDAGYDPRKVTQQWQANLYKALTGRTAKINAPKASQRYNTQRWSY